MTVRTAELLMAIMMGIFSIYLMYKSTELPIGWIEDEGPGGGLWPFWLAAIMLVSCLGILYNWFRKKGKIATSTKTYIEAHVLGDVGAVAASLIITVGVSVGARLTITHERDMISSRTCIARALYARELRARTGASLPSSRTTRGPNSAQAISSARPT